MVLKRNKTDSYSRSRGTRSVLQQRALLEIPNAKAGARVILDEIQSHHFSNVLRTKPGYQFIVVDKLTGKEFFSEVKVANEAIEVELLYETLNPTSKSRVRTLACAILKGDKNDLICEKATELGAQRIIFFASERSVVKVSKDQESKKIERWHKIAQGASAQSRRNFVPQILFCENVGTLIDAVKANSHTSDKFWCCALGKNPKTFKELSCPQHCHLVVGPEGDLSPKELETLVGSGFELVSLGHAVLKAETAAIAAMASVEALWGSEKHEL